MSEWNEPLSNLIIEWGINRNVWTWIIRMWMSNEHSDYEWLNMRLLSKLEHQQNDDVSTILDF